MEGVVTHSILDRDFWRDRSVFLTGHTGFKGGWLCLLLQDLGAQVDGYALAEEPNAIFEVADVRSALRSHRVADVRDLSTMVDAMRDARPSIVFHLAAQALVRSSYDDPISTYATNVMGTANVLEAVRRLGNVEAVVIVTSDKCYDNREWVWGYRENEAMGGHDPYSSSKGCAELVTNAYRDSFFGQGGTRIASARAGNVVGGGDRARDRIVPDLIRALEADRLTLIRNPKAVRPWQHVLEPLSGYVQLAQRLAGKGGASCAGGWNFGPDEGAERNVSEVADAVSRWWGSGVGWSLDAGQHPHEAHFLTLDSSKARRHLGWRPVWDFEETIRETVAWYRSAVEGEDMRSFTKAQIKAYRQRQAPLPS